MSTGAAESIAKMEMIMATHGLIRELRTDNGPPFTSREWEEYLRCKTTKRRRITPRWPQANGEVERFMRTLLKVVRIAQANNHSVERAIYSFLADYRLTPHSTTGVPPSVLCIGRRVANTLPHHPNGEIPRPTSTDAGERRRMRNDQVSQRRRAKKQTFRPGELVLVKDRHPGSKFCLSFEPTPWSIVRVRGTMITATKGGEFITRNVSFFKRHQAPLSPPGEAVRPRGLVEDSANEHAGSADLTEELPEVRPATSGPQGHLSPASNPARVEPTPAGDVPEASQRSLATRYNLRNNPASSQRLRDYELS